MSEDALWLQRMHKMWSWVSIDQKIIRKIILLNENETILKKFKFFDKNVSEPVWCFCSAVSKFVFPQKLQWRQFFSQYSTLYTAATCLFEGTLFYFWRGGYYLSLNQQNEHFMGFRLNSNSQRKIKIIYID